MSTDVFYPLRSLISTSDTFQAKVGAANAAEAQASIFFYGGTLDRAEGTSEEEETIYPAYESPTVVVYIDVNDYRSSMERLPVYPMGNVKFFVEEVFGPGSELASMLMEHETWVSDMIEEMLLNARCNVPGAELIVRGIRRMDRPASTMVEDHDSIGNIIRSTITVDYGVNHG